MKNKLLFISKESAELKKYLSFFEAHQIAVIAHSFLQFEALSFQVKKTYELVFFSSPRAVRFYFQQTNLPPNCHTACIGKTTAEALSQEGISADFIGDHAGNPSQIATQFKQWAGKKNILFPQSSTSNRSIVKVFSETQVEEVEAYQTVIVAAKIPTCDTYVFTSPSNVEGFLKENKIASGANVIAWGKTTKKSLNQHGIDVHHTLLSASLEELLTVLEKMEKGN